MTSSCEFYWQGEIENQSTQISQLKKYIGESEDIPKPVEVACREGGLSYLFKGEFYWQAVLNPFAYTVSKNMNIQTHFIEIMRKICDIFIETMV